MKTKISFIIIFFTVFALQSQVNTYSPYSYFGLGSIQNSNSTYFLSMGGLSNSLALTTTTNFSNPASYSFLNQTSFNFGFLTNITKLTQYNIEQKNNTTSLSNISLAFPISNKSAIAVGVFPYSSVGYNISRTIFTNEIIGQEIYKYYGSGGLNKLVLGYGRQILKNFSLGFNLNYLFGPINSNLDITTQNSTIEYRDESLFAVSDYNFEIGTLYSFKINEKKINIASIFTPESNIKSSIQNFQYTFTSSGDFENFVDTISFSKNQEGIIELPYSVKVGFSIMSEKKWNFGVDYNYTNWKNLYSSINSTQFIEDENRFIVGGSFVPNEMDIYSYWKRVRYCVGLSYSYGYVNISDLFNLQGDEMLEDLSLSLGASLPMNKVLSRANIGIKYGVRDRLRSNVSSKVIGESYFSFMFSMTLNEKWFKKRKID